MTYLALKHLHAFCAVLTLMLFLLRGFWMLTDTPRLTQRWVRIVPHVNDTLLLLAAIGMLIVGSLDPLEQPWLLAKIAGLVLYIGLGTLAFKRRSLPALLAALAVFAWIAAVAVSKQVVPGLN